ncbi:MAG: terminase family protein [Myxococcota bacterium]
MVWGTAIDALTRDPLRLYAEEPPGWGGMSVAQEAFHTSTDRKRIFRAANGLGKSYAGAAEAWWHLLNAHPHRQTRRTTGTGWVLCQDLTAGWPNISRVLQELEPPDVLDPRCKYVDGVGYTFHSRKIVKIKDELGGGKLVGKGCKQDLMSLEGERIDWFWCDEPPKIGHFNACRSRVNRTLGPVWITLTPINRPVEWLQLLVEGLEDQGFPAREPDWWGAHKPWALTKENAPHLSDEKLEVMATEVEEHERPQRIGAEWEGYTTGRRFPHFHEGLIVDDEDLPEKGFELRLSMDHGEGDANQLIYLHLLTGNRRSRRYWTFFEGCPEKAGATPDDIVDIILNGLDEYGLSPYHIKRAFGDANSAGLLGGGAKYNAFIERALADRLGLSACPFEIELPAKRAGSVAAGESGMNTAMREGRWFVHQSCRRLIRAGRHYTLKRESDLKNAVDGARYGILDELLSWQEAAGQPIVRG